MPPPWSRLEGHVVMVTGTSSGIGRDFCLDLACASYRVVIAARCVDRLRSLCDEINASAAAEGPRMVAVELAAAAGGSVLEAVVQRAWDAFGRINALINNAGIQDHDKLGGLLMLIWELSKCKLRNNNYFSMSA